jgi:endonuclease/exonuclease/phosphatase family metal-dependent hydrolase
MYPNAIMLGDFNTYNRTEYNINQLDKLYEVKGNYAADNFQEMGIKNMNILKTRGENQLFSDIEYEKLIPIDVLKYAGWNDAFEINGIPSPINTSHFSGKTDYIFLSPHWNLQINGLYTHYSTLSDHLPLIIDIN